MPVEHGAGGSLTDGLSRRRTALQRIVRLGLACVCLLLVSAQAVAARVTVVLSDDSAPYQEVYQVIRAYLDDTSHEVSRVYAERLNAVSLNESRLAVAVGVRAAESLAALSDRPPVLAVLVPRAWYVKTGRTRLSDGGGRSASAIYLDQPFERQVRLIRQAFPEVRRVGVLVSAEQSGLVGELDEALRAQRLSLVHVTLSGEERLITALENVLSDSRFAAGGARSADIQSQHRTKPFSDFLSLPCPGSGLLAFVDAGGCAVVAAFQSCANRSTDRRMGQGRHSGRVGEFAAARAPRLFQHFNQ